MAATTHSPLELDSISGSNQNLDALWGTTNAQDLEAASSSLITRMELHRPCSRQVCVHVSQDLKSSERGSMEQKHAAGGPAGGELPFS